jgi:hypothetical protein
VVVLLRVDVREKRWAERGTAGQDVRFGESQK